MKIELIHGDITKVNVDTIVNAANNALAGGGGVDGAIHRAGGPQILEDCQRIIARQGECRTGDAVVTTAGNLPATYVFHTVGPVWQNGQASETEKLSGCYAKCIRLAEQLRIKSIAFPNISTGIYRFPKELAARIAIETIRGQKTASLEKVLFVCFDEENYEIYKSLLNQTYNEPWT